MTLIDPMWPIRGQGAAQAVEDAGVLGVLMNGLKDKSEVPRRLAMYDELRIGRTSVAQLLSRASEVVMAGKEVSKDIAVRFREFAGARGPGWCAVPDPNRVLT
jgi:2-polyprenyl-6-methoxyphenol hydroxylase-like FAD-dependent oxidoreductase